MEDWRRAPGRGKYARVERERRFLVVGEPPLSGPGRSIEDRYLEGTTLRLRRLTVEGAEVHKLTQKVRWSKELAEVSTTNTYLTAEEFALFATLPALVVSKTRWLCAVDEWVFAVDVFSGALDGLRLAEVEVGSMSDRVPTPPWLGPEVTYDDRYTGGALARASELPGAEL